MHPYKLWSQSCRRFLISSKGIMSTRVPASTTSGIGNPIPDRQEMPIKPQKSKELILPQCLDNLTWRSLFVNPVIQRYMLSPDSVNVMDATQSVDNSLRKAHRNPQKFIVEEVMAECSINNIVPSKFLELEIHRLKLLRELLGYVYVASKPECENQDRQFTVSTEFKVLLMDAVDNTIATLEVNLSTAGISSSFFKRSVHKTHLDKAFIPTNLHIQHLILNDELNNSAYFVRHDVTTVGAFNAQLTLNHTEGLSQLLEPLDDNSCHVNRSDLVNSQDKTLVHRRRSSDTQTRVQDPLVRNYTRNLAVIEICCDLLEIWRALAQQFDNSEHPKNTKLSVQLLQDLQNCIEKAHQYEPKLTANLIRSPLVADMELLNEFLNAFQRLDHPSLTANLSNSTTTSSDLVDLERMNHHFSHYVYTLIFSNLCSSDVTALLSLKLREDIVFSQIITSTTAAVLAKLYTTDSLRDRHFVRNITTPALGLLVYYESLLSCWADEKIMLEDIVGILPKMQLLRFVIPIKENGHQLDVASEISIRRMESSVTEITLPPVSRCDVAAETGISSLLVNVYPVFLNIGINEKASLAENSDHIKLQKKNNQFYGLRLLDYVAAENSSENHQELILPESELEEFRRVLHQNVPKNIELLHAAQKLARLLQGVRLTMCKSAKDRTAMAVTLEQISILEEVTNFGVAGLDKVLTEMRRHGTRRINTLKNIGFAKYAFDQDQMERLPVRYQPPPGTYGKYDT